MAFLKQMTRRRTDAPTDASLTVLITNLTLSGRTGTEIVTRDLALGLRRRGHRPVIYTRNADGPIARELEQASIPVTTDIAGLTVPVDIIHGHHTPTAAAAVSRYPDVPAIFLAHDFIAWHDCVPRLGSIRRLCAVDTTVAQRFVTRERCDPSDVTVLLNAVDMDRFRPGPALSRAPQRALAFAKNTGHLEAIREACRQRNIDLDVVGKAVGNVLPAPEAALGHYDLVFTSALSALEAMACGRAVIACDGRGLAGLVTPENMRAWRQANYGLGILTRRLSAENVLADIDRYDARSAKEIQAFIRKDADQELWLDRVEEIYREVRRENRDTSRHTSFAEISEHLQDWSPCRDNRWPWVEERERLKDELAAIRLGVEAPAADTSIVFSTGADMRCAQLVEGFSRREKWGVWSDAGTAAILTRRPAGGDRPTGIRFTIQLFLPAARPTQQIDVLVNGTICAQWRFESGDRGQPRSLPCPLPEDLRAEQVWITFRIADPRSPLECGVSDDRRTLGLGLIDMAFT